MVDIPPHPLYFFMLGMPLCPSFCDGISAYMLMIQIIWRLVDIYDMMTYKLLVSVMFVLYMNFVCSFANDLGRLKNYICILLFERT